MLHSDNIVIEVVKEEPTGLGFALSTVCIYDRHNPNQRQYVKIMATQPGKPIRIRYNVRKSRK